MKVYFLTSALEVSSTNFYSLENRLFSDIGVVEKTNEHFTGKYTFLQMNDDIQIHDKYRYFTCLS